MLKSWSDEEDKSEWNDVVDEDHIAQVTEKIEQNFEKYFNSLVKPAAATGTDLLGQLGSKFKVKASKKPKSEPVADASVIEDALAAYERESTGYRDFFDAERINDYREDDPSAFKTDLARKCSVVRKLRQSKRRELQEWQIKFNRTPSADMLATFERLIGFADEYATESGDEDTYSELESWEDFAFDGYEEDAAGIPGVIGGGIKSLVLYHLNPRIFPSRSGQAMYGLFFLTDKSHFGLRSKTSEFLMIDDNLEGADVNIKMDHNYWYSYRLFTSYAMMMAKMLEKACKEHGISFDVDHRYVYVDAFFQHVCDRHGDEVKVMRGVDDLKEQHWAAR